LNIAARLSEANFEQQQEHAELGKQPDKAPGAAS
jgi:hypothetical protein